MSSIPFSAHSCHLQFYNLSQTGREQRGGGADDWRGDGDAPQYFPAERLGSLCRTS